MLKNILKLEGAQKLNKKEQNEVNGGISCCFHLQCLPGHLAQVNPITGICFCVPDN